LNLKNIIRLKIKFGDDILETPKITQSQSINESKILETIKSYIMTKIIYFILGIVLSRNVIFENYLPFGAALVSSVSYENMWPALIGTIFGYLLASKTIFGIRYIATVLAIQAIRWTFNDLARLKEHPFFSPILAFVVTLATGMSLNIHYFSFSKSLSIIFIEALISAVFSYFFKETAFFISGTRYKLNVKTQKIVSGIVITFIVILSFSSIKVGDISLGRILGIFLILIASHYFNLQGGSVAGIFSGIIFGFSNPSLHFISGSYAFSGMISGLFSRYGKFVTAVTFIISNLIIVVQNKDPINTVITIYELFFASLLFLFIPEKLTGKIFYFFDVPVSKSSDNKLEVDTAIINRLNSTATSLDRVTESINKVSEKLLNFQKNTVPRFLSNVKKDICSHCGLKTLCWENKRDYTSSFFDEFYDTLKSNDKDEISNFKNKNIGKCQRIYEIENYINKYIKNEKIKISLKSKNEEIKTIISEQFSEMSDILNDISNDFSEDQFLDNSLSEKISNILKEKNISKFDVICKVNKFGRIKVEIIVPDFERERLINLNLHKIISKESFKSFAEPIIKTVKENCTIKIIEKPRFKLQIGACQHICNNGTWCGDNFSYFDDENGNMIFVLSDGMGTGGMAAIEGALACEILSDLLKTGMNVETALKITNSALLLKPDDESLAAIDVVFINLYTGQVSFIKAGAAASFIKTSEKTQKVELSSLPIGIFKDISFFSQSENLKSGDWVLILSDGAIFPDEMWIEESLKNNKFLDSQNLAEDIVNKAIKKRENDYDDDITVIAVKIE